MRACAELLVLQLVQCVDEGLVALLRRVAQARVLVDGGVQRVDLRIDVGSRLLLVQDVDRLVLYGSSRVRARLQVVGRLGARLDEVAKELACTPRGAEVALRRPELR